ncbi:MAG: MBL fold metallo-hydrolase [Thermodesulfobacteriota bacterium]
MRLRVLGCYGTELFDYHATSFLVNEAILIDAGTTASAMTMEDQLKIRNILLSHSHLDHVQGLFFLADNLFERFSATVTIYSTRGILGILKTHYFNNLLSPDFTSIPDKKNPIMRFRPIAPGESFEVNGLMVNAFKANHVVESVGYKLQDGNGAILYSGDTGATPWIWKEAREQKGLKAIFVETSFPNRLSDLARLTGHLTPSMLEEELKKIGGLDVPIFIFHMKPQYLETITAEIEQLNHPNISILKQGDEFTF